jgi:hypothetical protein
MEEWKTEMRFDREPKVRSLHEVGWRQAPNVRRQPSMGVGDASARQLIRLRYHSTIAQMGHLQFRRPVDPVRWSVYRGTSDMGLGR